MTTIVYRDGVLATDTRETLDESGVYYRDDCQKVFETDTGGYIASSGDSAGLDKWIDCYHDLGNEDKRWRLEEYADFSVLIWDSSGLFVSDQTMTVTDISDVDFYAIGSGSKAAIGAMHMGASAEKAVQVASLCDPYTSAIVKTYRL